MITTTTIFVVALVLAVLFLLYNLQRFGTAKKHTINPETFTSIAPQNQWSLSQIDDVAILSAGDSHDIMEYAFIWDLINDRDEVKYQKDLLFDAKHFVIDFTRASYFGHFSCEFQLLNFKYIQIKRKPIIFCGVNDWMRSTFDLLQCRQANNSIELFELYSLEEALDYCRSLK